jgi:hypothetical protein
MKGIAMTITQSTADDQLVKPSGGWSPPADARVGDVIVAADGSHYQIVNYHKPPVVKRLWRKVQNTAAYIGWSFSLTLPVLCIAAACAVAHVVTARMGMKADPLWYAKGAYWLTLIAAWSAYTMAAARSSSVGALSLLAAGGIWLARQAELLLELLSADALKWAVIIASIGIAWRSVAIGLGAPAYMRDKYRTRRFWQDHDGYQMPGYRMEIVNVNGGQVEVR